jgi:hypothetical protein
LRRASKRFWLLVSLLALTALGFQSAQQANGLRRLSESTLAGFRPGLHSIQNAERANRQYFHTFKRSIRQDGPEQTIESRFVWSDSCPKQELTITARNDAIQSVEIGSLTGSIDADGEINGAPNPWKAGNGLSLGHPCRDVAATYGNPESETASSKAAVKLESYLCSFDRARTNAPQVMEVSWDTPTQNVVEIKLTAASLHGIS